MSKLMYNSPVSHVHARAGVYYFVRRVPADLRDYYSSDRISLSLRTRSAAAARKFARSMSSRLEDYWLGLRLQKLEIPAIHLVKMAGVVDDDDGFRLSEALDLYLDLKSANRDKVFIRTAQRNTEYVVRVLGDRPVTAYSSVDAGLFRDWLIDQGMGRSTVQRVFSSIRSIINLAISEKGLDGQNGFVGTYLPDSLTAGERKPIPIKIIQQIQMECVNTDDDLRWLVGLISDSGMRLGEAVGLLKSDIELDAEIPHINLRPHAWRRLKTAGSERQIPLVGISLWSAKRAIQSSPSSPFVFAQSRSKRKR